VFGGIVHACDEALPTSIGQQDHVGMQRRAKIFL
jgi:hypothetical protein